MKLTKVVLKLTLVILKKLLRYQVQNLIRVPSSAIVQKNFFQNSDTTAVEIS